MSPFIKATLILFGVICCMQLVQMARLKRDGTTANTGQTLNDLDVKALSNAILNRLKENLKDSGDTVKNIVNSASNSIQQRGGAIRAIVRSLL